MSRFDDMRRALEAAVGNLTPAKAQQLAKSFLEPGAAKEQVAKATADLLEWSQHNRDRMREMVNKEVQHQIRQMGAATQDELDALRKRVRELERQAGIAPGGTTPARKTRKTAARKPAAKKTTAKTAAAKRTAAQA
jgi:polyhydroxyalkanoate synthesis regulator phasin